MTGFQRITIYPMTTLIPGLQGARFVSHSHESWGVWEHNGQFCIEYVIGKV